MNNDRFKFRYYYITEKRYLKNSEIQAIACMSMIEQKVEDSAKVEQALCAAITGEIITEQCTGLKDKNGRLIYEGDIVFIHSGMTEGVIKFENGSFVFDWRFAKPLAIPILKDTDDVEIVGNIHEGDQ